MRFHVVNLPHTQVNESYAHCAYTEKVRKFCNMMTLRGHTVYLYASEDSKVSCEENIVCITKEEQKRLIGVNGPEDNLRAKFDPRLAYWQLMNDRAIEGIKKRAEPQDFICLIAGLCQKQIADALPAMMSVEYGIGYGGTFAPYQVFESYAWMHTVYGAKTGGDAHTADGRWYDAVIPNYYELKDFPIVKKQDRKDYFLYIGRLIDRKGYKIAVEVCKRLGKRLIVAGQGEKPEYGEYVGLVDPKQRAKLMSEAQAVFVPTLYIEPFGGVSAEAMLCGTPIITTDWGAFTENNIQGVTGFRCRNFAEFTLAMERVKDLDNSKIRQYAINKFGTDAVAKQYEDYFLNLMTLWNNGWYTERK